MSHREHAFEDLWNEPASRGAPFSDAEVASLPEGARRYLTHAIASGTPRASAVRLSMRADLPAETLAPIVMGTVQMLALSPTKARQRDVEARAVLGSLLALLRLPAVAPTSSRKSSP